MEVTEIQNLLPHRYPFLVLDRVEYELMKESSVLKCDDQ